MRVYGLMVDNFETILSGINSTYLLQLLEQYQSNPLSIQKDWHPILDELIKSYPFIESKPGWGMTYIDDDSKEPRTNTPPPSHEKKKAHVFEKILKDTIKAFFFF